MKKIDFQRNYTQYYGLCAIIGVTCLLIFLGFAWPTFAALQNGQRSPRPVPFVVACALIGLVVFFITQQHLKTYLTTSFTEEGIIQSSLWRRRSVFWADIIKVEVKYEANDPCLRPLQAKFETSDQEIYLTLSLFKNPTDVIAQIYEFAPANSVVAYDPYNPTNTVEKALDAPIFWWLCAFGLLGYSIWTMNPVSGVMVAVIIVLRLTGHWIT